MYDWDEFHAQLLRETFASVTPNEAVILVGLLHTCDIRLSRDLENLVRGADQWTPKRIHPRTLGDAVAIVSFEFGIKHGLRQAFEQQWTDVRDSVLARDLKERLAEHRFVDAIVEVYPF